MKISSTLTVLVTVAAGCLAACMDGSVGGSTSDVLDELSRRGGADFPEVVQVQSTAGMCLGALVAPGVVVTSGHCVAGATSWAVTAPFAKVQISSASSGAVFDPTLAHDVGAVFLRAPISLQSYPVLAQKPVDGIERLLAFAHARAASSADAGVATKVVEVFNAQGKAAANDLFSFEMTPTSSAGGPAFSVNKGKHVLTGVDSQPHSGGELYARIDLVQAWIALQITLHGNGTDGGLPSLPDGGVMMPDGGMPPPRDGGTPGPCVPVTPSTDFTNPVTVTGSVCAPLAAGVVDWFVWKSPAAETFDARIVSSFDATVLVYQMETLGWFRVPNLSATEVMTSAAAGDTFAIAVTSPSGQGGSYTLVTSP